MAKVLLISYDNQSHIPFVPLNILYLTHHLQNNGHHVGIWHQDLHHGKSKALTEILNNNKFDVVGLGFVAGYWQYRMAKEISDAVNKTKLRSKFIYVGGGHGPAAEPEYFLQNMGFDSVVIGDGESALLEIAQSGKKGVIHGDPCTEDKGPMETLKNWSRIIEIYKRIGWPTSKRTDFCWPILSSRGCKWHCSFCYRMREGFHERSTEAIIEEMKWLQTEIGITHFQFADELLMSSEKRTSEICEAILTKLRPTKWDCNGRLNFAKPKLLHFMKKAGCEYINYGIESLDQKILNEMGKGLTVEMIYKGVEATLEAKLSPGLNLLWGFPGDTVANLDVAVAFLKTYDPCHELRTIRPVTPYPGTPLYEKALGDGLLMGPKDFYENKHKNSDLFTVNFMDMSINEAHNQLHEANKKLLTNYSKKKLKENLYQALGLYFSKNPNFRGFREV